jgi:hypothetical protein
VRTSRGHAGAAAGRAGSRLGRARTAPRCRRATRSPVAVPVASPPPPNRGSSRNSDQRSVLPCIVGGLPISRPEYIGIARPMPVQIARL